ncbi:MAG: ECF transporter S component [Firmicutes bacterium]|nr:ECF transporter S component [Bacillota bacterium]
MTKRPSPFVWNFTTVNLVLIPVAVGINFVGKYIAAALKLPLWLDSIGTVLAGFLGGPWVGAVSGAVNNAIYGLTVDPMSFWYLITSIAIGLVAGYFAYTGWTKDVVRAFVLGLFIAVAATVVSFPINMRLWGGQTGNVWGDALFAALLAKNTPLWLASLLDEFVVDLPDKVATVLVAFAAFKALPERLVVLFRPKGRIEKI